MKLMKLVGLLGIVFPSLAFSMCVEAMEAAVNANMMGANSPRRAVAIVHHHLRAGGVTRVIENAVYALKKMGVETVVVVGEAPSHTVFAHRNIVVVPELNYADSYDSKTVPAILSKMETAVAQKLGQAPDVWHFHNPTLGKNIGVTAMVSAMAAQGYPLLLQLHDFAEDSRPANYSKLVAQWNEEKPLEEGLYPAGSNVQYAVLNGRDYQRLIAAGLPKAQLHFLPNPVWFQKVSVSPLASRPTGVDRLWLYPTRAIRRKNLGEFLFWASVAGEGNHFATTLAPAEGTGERAVYESWVGFAKQMNLPVTFEAGKQWKASFEQLLAEADTFVTTSVAEGFGLAFMEPWLMGTPVWGRDLPAITADFRQAGVELPGLYTRLDIPVSVIGQPRLEAIIDQELSRYLHAYGRAYTPQLKAQALQALLVNGKVDFGILNEDLQKEVITAVQNKTLPAGAPSYALCEQSVDPSVIEANAKILREQFGLDSYGQKLVKIYNQNLSPRGGGQAYVSAEGVLGAFLDPSGFCMLRN